jgi:guanylate kinase
VLAGPSGTGKTTITRELARRRSDVDFSISATTRRPREGEVDGADYHFLPLDHFQAMIDADQLLEWAEVHGNFYGTPRSNLDVARSRRHFLLLDIDVQGSRQIKQKVRDAVSVFVLPPSGVVLASRLIGRGSEDPERQRRRLLAAREEIRAATDFDFVIVNDDLSRAADGIEQILAGIPPQSLRIPDLHEHVDSLIGEIDRVLAS